MEAVQSCGTAIRIPNEKYLTILSIGEDPQLFLPELPIAPEGLAVRGRMRIRIDPDVAFAKVKAVIRALENRAGPEATGDLVRTAVAYPRSTGLVLEELTSRATRLQKHVTLSETHLQEQRQRAADSEKLLQIAMSEAVHYRNLLEEQQRRTADSENRLQIAASEAAHYRNLLEEQQRRAADSENRLQIAMSEAAHYRNLLEEQKRQA